MTEKAKQEKTLLTQKATPLSTTKPSCANLNTIRFARLIERVSPLFYGSKEFLFLSQSQDRQKKAELGRVYCIETIYLGYYMSILKKNLKTLEGKYRGLWVNAVRP